MGFDLRLEEVFFMARRVLVALLLAAVLVAPAAAVAATGHTPPRSRTAAAEPGVFVRAWQALLSLFAPNGPDMDPNGTPKLGPGMDPDGTRNLGPGTATTPTVDNGPDMDPDGK